MKQHLGIILFIVVLLCLLGIGLLYWYEYRPADIRALCAEEQKVKSTHPKPPWDKTEKRVRSYQQCLEENGI
jgi:hypothetical protein